MISKYLISLFALAASVPLAKSTPVDATVLDVWAPHILFPNDKTSWCIGDEHHIVWDAKNPPSEITNNLGQAILAKNGVILFEHVLASGFKLEDGRVSVKVPDVPTGPYQVVLIGDSGNYSPEFSITKCY
ncbi:hypothetical protein JVU11DRAFT_8710 [Chiua virens]|nr:hypothetical protein JVU11DRAFT_8710 [Chiua virens]